MRMVVLGGGPGGYVAAIRAAQLGAEVTLVEKKALGGTCLNVGCIPTKVLLHTSELFAQLKQDGREIGLDIPEMSVNWQQLQKHKDKIIRLNANGIANLLKTNRIAWLKGTGSFADKRKLEVVLENGERQEVEFDNAVIATGSRPARVPIPGLELDGVLTSDEALSLPEVPKSLCIIGGGVIGCEFASVYSSLGCRVTIVEMQPELIGNMDQDTVQCLEKELVKSGVRIHAGARVERIDRGDAGLAVTVGGAGSRQTIEAEKVLVAIGRSPVTEGLGLEKLGVALEKGRILTNNRMETTVGGIYAIGDCTGGAMLAHVASAQGITAVESMLNEPTDIDFRTIPYCVYTRPELAAVGITEKQAAARGIKVDTGVFPLQANGKSMIIGETGGLVKIVADAGTGEVLGVHMAGPRATELIVEGALAIRLEATVEELLTTIHAHPTVGEALHEAAHAVQNTAIHIPPVRQG